MSIRDWFQSRDSGPIDVANRVGQALEEIAAGKVVDVKKTAALQTVCGLYSRAFAGLVPSPGDPRISAAYLSSVGAELVLAGVSYRLIDRDSGELVEVVDVAPGSNLEGERFYKLKVKHPGREAGAEQQVSADRVIAIHATFGASPARRSLALQALAALEARIELYASTPALYLQTRENANVGAAAAIKATELVLKMLKKKWSILPIPPNYEVKEAADVMPESLTRMHDALQSAVFSSYGIPPDLASSTSGGASVRESFRRWARTGVMPLARVASEEISGKLGIDGFRLSSAQLGALDIPAIGRGLKALTDAGIALDEAREIVGV